MNDQLHIVIYATSATRRSRMAELVRRSSSRAAISCLSRLELSESMPDVCIFDVETSAAASSILEFLKDFPEHVGLVALIDDADQSWVRSALLAGVNAIISREPDREELRLALEAAQAGFVLLHPSSAQSLALHALEISQPESELSEHLTPREREVLRLIADGLGNKEIAARLVISEHTAKFHISSILGKLSVSSRAEAVTQGIRRGLIPI